MIRLAHHILRPRGLSHEPPCDAARTSPRSVDPARRFVSAVHLGVGLIIMTFFWTTKLVKFEKPDAEFLKAVTLPSFLHAFGHCLTNVSFAAVAVSFTHTIKTLEPVFTAIGSFMVGCRRLIPRLTPG